MSVASFIPKVWASALDVPFQKALVYADPTIASTEFQPLLQNSGDSVEINDIGSATIKEHDRTQDLEYDDLDTTSKSLVIDQEDYYGFRVNDVDKLQAAGDFQSAATEQHAIGMADKVDTYLAAELRANAGTKIGTLDVFNGQDFYRPGTDQKTAWDVIRRIVKELNKVSAPPLNRWAVDGPDFADALHGDRRVNEVDKAGTDRVVRSGLIAEIPHLGISIKTSNNVPTTAGREVVTAGVPGALQFASQLRTLEAFRDPNRFGDIVRGLQVYGAKVVRPKGVVSVETNVGDGVLGGSTGGGAEGNA